jgi:hypothetical protein
LIRSQEGDGGLLEGEELAKEVPRGLGSFEVVPSHPLVPVRDSRLSALIEDLLALDLDGIAV